jgi:hypothetical protein
MQTSPGTQVLLPHANGAPASTGSTHEVWQVQPPLYPSQTGWHLQFEGQLQMGGGPLQNGGGHGGVGGQVHWPPTHTSGCGPVLPHPPGHTGAPSCPSTQTPPELPLLVPEVPELDPPDDELDPPDEELDAPDDDAPDVPELAPLELPELPELDPPPTGTTVPPHATRRRVARPTARRVREGVMRSPA